MAVLVMLVSLSGVAMGLGGERRESHCWNSTVLADDEAVMVVCRLEHDVSKTRHGVALVPTYDERDRLLDCGWNGQKCPVCSLKDGVQPVGDLTDVLTVMVPANRPRNGHSYKHQLVPPPDRDDVYVPCEVFRIDPRAYVPEKEERVINPTSTEVMTTTVQTKKEERVINHTSTEIMTTTVQTHGGEDCPNGGNDHGICSPDKVVHGLLSALLVLNTVFWCSVMLTLRGRTVSNCKNRPDSELDHAESVAISLRSSSSSDSYEGNKKEEEAEEKGEKLPMLHESHKHEEKIPPLSNGFPACRIPEGREQMPEACLV